MKMNVPDWETSYIKFIKCFIHDGCAFWDPAAEISDDESAIKFDKFKSPINNNKGLTWEFTELSILRLTRSAYYVLTMSLDNL